MSAGITRVNGSAEVGASSNVTGRKSTFFGGYQPLFVKIQTLTAAYDFSTAGADNKFDHFIKACEVVGTVVGYGTPSTSDVGSSCTVVVMFDAASVNQGDGTGGQNGATTGFGVLKSAIVGAAALDSVTIVAGQVAVTTYTGFAGVSFAA
jgi:hypothetical protein